MIDTKFDNIRQYVRFLTRIWRFFDDDGWRWSHTVLIYGSLDASCDCAFNDTYQMLRHSYSHIVMGDLRFFGDAEQYSKWIRMIYSSIDFLCNYASIDTHFMLRHSYGHIVVSVLRFFKDSERYSALMYILSLTKRCRLTIHI